MGDAEPATTAPRSTDSIARDDCGDAVLHEHVVAFLSAALLRSTFGCRVGAVADLRLCAGRGRNSAEDMERSTNRTKAGRAGEVVA